MKVYITNYDGRRWAMVAAKNQKEAAKAIGTTLYDFRNYATEAHKEDDVDIAMSKPGAVFLSGMNHILNWVEMERK